MFKELYECTLFFAKRPKELFVDYGLILGLIFYLFFLVFILLFSPIWILYRFNEHTKEWFR